MPDVSQLVKLDDAIKHAKAIADDHYTKAQEAFERFCTYHSDSDKAEYDRCTFCAEEHRQLSIWLEDYKRLIENTGG